MMMRMMRDRAGWVRDFGPVRTFGAIPRKTPPLPCRQLPDMSILIQHRLPQRRQVDGGDDTN